MRTNKNLIRCLNDMLAKSGFCDLQDALDYVTWYINRDGHSRIDDIRLGLALEILEVLVNKTMKTGSDDSSPLPGSPSGH